MEQDKKNTRNQGIDLLRIILIFMVCIQHVVTKADIMNTGTNPNAYVYWFIDMFCCCAVDSYAMISGYVSNKNTIQYKRIVSLWLQAIFYSFAVSLIMNLFFFKKELSLSFVIKSLMPITNNTFWYITAYIPLLFLMPFINRHIDSLEDKELKELFVVILYVFSFLALLGDSWSSYGYSCIWIVILYVIGRIIQKINLFKRLQSSSLLLLYLLSIAVTWLSFYITGIPRMEEYISPTIMLCAMILVVVFSRIGMQNGSVRKISALTLGIYLLQGNPYFSQFYFQKVLPLDGINLLPTLLLVFLKSLLLMMIGCAVEQARLLIFRILKIDKLESVLSKILESIIDRLQVILEYLL
ncbi:MAG: acyltransferase [Erysipelotrichaceae bacterium]|nr:acyltransferase [Erysipelotrichaceae bacterium]